VTALLAHHVFNNLGALYDFRVLFRELRENLARLDTINNGKRLAVFDRNCFC
jgi:hypothetical protein